MREGRESASLLEIAKSATICFPYIGSAAIGARVHIKRSQKEMKDSEAETHQHLMPLKDWKSTVFPEPLSITEIEKTNLYPNDGRVPHVPFGFSNPTWLEFKSKIREGDVIMAYSSDGKKWKRGFGREGYILVRGDMIVADQITRMS